MKLKEINFTQITEPFQCTSQHAARGNTQGPETGSSPLPQALLEVVDREREVCTAAALKYPNNYNAWSHRIWLLKTYCSCNRQVREMCSQVRYYNT